MEEAFVSLVTAFLIDNNELMNQNAAMSNYVNHELDTQAINDESEREPECFDFIPSFKDFMVPQRDRAFSWDIMFENGLHSDLSGNITMNGIPQDHLLHFPGDSMETNEESKKLIIRAKFPSKPQPPKVKEESALSKSSKGSQIKEQEAILETDTVAEDDPLLLSIPNDLLLDNGDLLGFEEHNRSERLSGSFDKTGSKRSRDGRSSEQRGDIAQMTGSMGRNYSESLNGLQDASSSSFLQQKAYFPTSNHSQSSGYMNALGMNDGLPFHLTEGANGAMRGSQSMGNLKNLSPNQHIVGPNSHSQGFSIPHGGAFHQHGYEKRVGIYTVEERRIKIEKFREKKRQRIWRKQIKYDCRKRLADTRPRVKGRFVSRKNQGTEENSSFVSPCGSRDATTNEQSDEDDIHGHPLPPPHSLPPKFPNSLLSQSTETAMFHQREDPMRAQSSSHSFSSGSSYRNDLRVFPISKNFNTIGNTASLLNHENSLGPPSYSLYGIQTHQKSDFHSANHQIGLNHHHSHRFPSPENQRVYPSSTTSEEKKS